METLGDPTTIELMGMAECIMGRAKLILFDYLRMQEAAVEAEAQHE